jgi:hypothetical protein
MHHYFAFTSHFKGPHDGIGAVIKRAADLAVARGEVDAIFNTPEDFYIWVKKMFERGELCSAEDFDKAWSRYRVRQFFVRYVCATELLDRPTDNDALSGIVGTQSLYCFMGPKEGHGEVIDDAEAAKRDRGVDWVKKLGVDVRRLSCQCSSCRKGKFAACWAMKTQSALVDEARRVYIKETVPGSGGDGWAMSEDDIGALVVRRLREVAEQCGLDKSGSKRELTTRIIAAKRARNPPVAAAAAAPAPVMI